MAHRLIWRHNLRAKKGFTILEVLLALLLFAVGVVSIAGLYSIGLGSSLDAENTGIALSLAHGRAEEIRNKDYASIANEAKAQVPGFTAFQRQVAVTEPFSELKQVTVTVYWPHKGSETSVPVVTYVSKN